MGRKRSKSTPREVIDVEPDRISCLPGHVIDCILSYLPIKEAVRTSVLSSNWRHKWYTLPNLVIDTKCIPHVKFAEKRFLKFVDHVLLVHSGAINMFKFVDYDQRLTYKDAHVDRWILHLTGRSIEEFVMDFYTDEQFNLPWRLFSFGSLRRLKLKWCWLEPPMTYESFRNLKSINIMLATVDQEAFENLISNCPLLEELKLTEVDGLDQINIRAPNLKLFQIVGEFKGISFDNTFQLTTIVIHSWLDLNSESNQRKLHGRSSNLLKFFVHQPHIQSLDIGGYFLKYLAAGVLPVKLPTPCIDLSNLSLRINFYDLNQISAALCLLRSSPNLRKLEILARRFRADTLTSPTYCWEDIFSGPVMAFRVQHVRIDGSGISGTKSELDFIKYILLYSPVLEKMTVKPVANVVPKLRKALMRFKRASREAKVIWEDPAEVICEDPDRVIWEDRFVNGE
ncbi:F-box/FBD/LRR-repeat protein [Trifolium repens]|nr:F-box/FBD/LRR-repeat protein [Trifolium repens]